MKPTKVYQLIVRDRCRIGDTWFKKGDIIEAGVSSYHMEGMEMYALYLEGRERPFHIQCRYLRFYSVPEEGKIQN